MLGFVILVTGFPENINAQHDTTTDLFEELENKRFLSSEAVKRVETINIGDRNRKNAVVVQLPERLYEFRHLNIYLDDDGELLRGNNRSGTLVSAEYDTIIVSNNGLYLTWMGTIKYKDYNIGDISLTQDKEGHITGLLSVNNQSFRIRPLEKTYHIMYQEIPVKRERVKTDTDERKKLSAKEIESSDINEQTEYSDELSYSNENVVETMSSGVTNIHVAVFYTQAALQQKTSAQIQGVVVNSISQTNGAFANSGISNTMLQIERIELLPGFSETADIEEDLEQFQSMASGIMLGEADIAVLLTHGTEGHYGPAQIKGQASVLASESKRHAIVQVNSADGGARTFAHEVGHLLGAQHHPDFPLVDTGPSWARGHRFSYFSFPWWQRRSTIMTYEFKGSLTYSTIPHFSNPNVTYSGNTTGNSDRNNATYMGMNVAHVASLGGDALSATIGGSVNVHTGAANLTANADGGVGNYSYVWKWTWLANNSTYTVGTNQQLSFNFPPGDHLVTLEVTSGSDTFEASRYYYVMFGSLSMSDFQEGLQKEVLHESESVETSLVSLHPNPFNPTTKVTFSLENKKNVTVEVYDMLGRKVSTLHQGELAGGTHHVTFEAGSLSSGTYIIRMIAGDQVFTRQLSLIK